MTTAPAAVRCSGALPGPAVTALLGPGLIRESGAPQVPRPRQLTSQCQLRSADRRTTLSLATSAAEVTGRVTLQDIANNTPATAVPVAAGAIGLVDPGLAWLARPCAERRTLLVSLQITSGPDPASADPGQLATALIAATAWAAAAADCDRGTTPAPAAPPRRPEPRPVTGNACGVPVAALTPATGPLAGWTTTAPVAGPDAPARTCELAAPTGARIRFVVSRGAVAANAGRQPFGARTPVAGLPGAAAGPDGARLDRACRTEPIAYRLHLDSGTADTGRISALFNALVRTAAAEARCPLD